MPKLLTWALCALLIATPTAGQALAEELPVEMEVAGMSAERWCLDEAATRQNRPPTTCQQVKPVETVMYRRVTQLLDLIHQRVRDVEWPVCLRGRVTADSTIISDVSAAAVDSVGLMAANFNCLASPDMIGIAHNHPPGSIECGVSLEDLVLFDLVPALKVIVHTCDAEDGRTAIIVRRRDHLMPATDVYEGTLGLAPRPR